MALPHAQPEQPIDLAPLGARLADTPSHALLKTDALELMRIVLRAGQALPPHAVDAEATLYCIEGAVTVETDRGEHRLPAGTLIVFAAGCRHAVRAETDASLLLTVLLPYAGSASATSPG